MDDLKPTSSKSSVHEQPSLLRSHGIQEEVRRLEQRQKQIDFGKNTMGYQNYLKKIPKEARKCGDPTTPDATLKDVSKKKFDGQIKAWRRQLHLFDDSAVSDEPSKKKRDHQSAFEPGGAELDPHQSRRQKQAGKDNMGKAQVGTAKSSAAQVEDLLRWADEDEDVKL